ncbi:hypothetical protein FB458_3414 [Lapillicoccus jejuensis]|uniref:Uncharacterized protein n=1 Tax=Lapillicoccus jejuensis TaxID=402171 RepID=A0A542E4U9_9MICO|nr:hypothetical protein FB458_3414 [Lapillicoccus jejuensis]
MSTAGVTTRRRYLVRQTVVAAVVLVAVGVLLLVLRGRWPATSGPDRVPFALVLGVAALGVVATVASRWWADLRSPEGRALWSGADRHRVGEVRARLVQRMPLPPEDRAVAAALVRAESSPPGQVASLVEALGAVAGPAVVFLPQFPGTPGVVAVALVAGATVGPRWWMRRRLLTSARTAGLLP